MFNYEVIHEGVGVIAEGMTNRVWDEEELEDFIARLFPGTGAYTFTAFDDEVGAFAQTTITV